MSNPPYKFTDFFKTLSRYEQSYGNPLVSDLLRMVVREVEATTVEIEDLKSDTMDEVVVMLTKSQDLSTEKLQELDVKFEKNLELFGVSQLAEFKKVWAKLKEIQDRLPGPIVTPPPPPVPEPVKPTPPPAPAPVPEPVEPAPEDPEAEPKTIKRVRLTKK